MDGCVNEKVKPRSQLLRLRSVLDALPLAYARNNDPPFILLGILFRLVYSSFSSFCFSVSC